MAGSSPTLEAEWSLLRAVCSGNLHQSLRSSINPAIRWKPLFALAEHHGVLPLLYQALSATEGPVPADEMHSLTGSYQTNLQKALFLSREFIRIANCLDAAGIQFLPHKGLALAEAVYGDIALRQSGDIDLLIRQKDLPRSREAVLDLGYAPHSPLSEPEEQAYLKSGYECAFDSAAGRNLLEVQWSIQPRFYAVDYDMEGLFKRAVPLVVAGRSVKTPSLEDLFIVLSLHAAKHVWGRLIWLCDLVRIIDLTGLNWSWIGSETAKLGVVRIVRVTLLLAQRLLGAAIPAAAENSLPQDSTSAVLAEEIERKIASQSDLNVESFDYFRHMLRLRERPTDRLRFLARLAFTPGPGEWSTIHLPRPLFPLYRLIRISRLAARVVGG